MRQKEKTIKYFTNYRLQAAFGPFWARGLVYICHWISRVQTYRCSQLAAWLRYGRKMSFPSHFLLAIYQSEEAVIVRSQVSQEQGDTLLNSISPHRHFFHPSANKDAFYTNLHMAILAIMKTFRNIIILQGQHFKSSSINGSQEHISYVVSEG